MRSRQYAAAVRMWAAGMTGTQIAEALGLESEDVYRVVTTHREDFGRRRRYQRVTPTDAMLMRAMRDHGMTYAQITEATGHDAKTIRRWCCRAEVEGA